MGIICFQKQLIIEDARFPKWCACCGIKLPKEADVIRVRTSDGKSLIILKSHLLSWFEEPSDQMTFTLPDFQYEPKEVKA